mmetsp:Transcript_10258/g.18637  ORF Transcript_10258/g.18637 Transcript_10258/m.18637 type:complete len:84 (+) Transcript_10258:468-719(+)
MLHLSPGESYTFSQDVAYATPGPCQYCAEVEIFEKTMPESFPFRLVWKLENLLEAQLAGRPTSISDHWGNRARNLFLDMTLQQ